VRECDRRTDNATVASVAVVGVADAASDRRHINYFVDLVLTKKLYVIACSFVLRNNSTVSM